MQQQPAASQAAAAAATAAAAMDTAATVKLPATPAARVLAAVAAAAAVQQMAVVLAAAEGPGVQLVTLVVMVVVVGRGRMGVVEQREVLPVVAVGNRLLRLRRGRLRRYMRQHNGKRWVCLLLHAGWLLGRQGDLDCVDESGIWTALIVFCT
jgi:hypothetical protein